MDAETAGNRTFPNNPFIPYSRPALNIGTGLALSNNGTPDAGSNYNPNSTATLSVATQPSISGGGSFSVDEIAAITISPGGIITSVLDASPYNVNFYSTNAVASNPAIQILSSTTPVTGWPRNSIPTTSGLWVTDNTYTAILPGRYSASLNCQFPATVTGTNGVLIIANLNASAPVANVFAGNGPKPTSGTTGVARVGVTLPEVILQPGETINFYAQQTSGGVQNVLAYVSVKYLGP